MYIGENKDPRSLFAEVFDNAIDELHNGAKSVDIYIDTSTNTYRVVDTGRGIPIGQIPIPDSDLTEEVLKVLTSRTGSGAKFDNSTFKIRSGMNGVGLAVVSSLSSKVTYKTTRDGKSVICTYVNGEFDNLEYQDVKNNKIHGVEVIFTVDESSIFQNTEVPLRYIIDRCKIAAMFLKGGKLNLYVDNEAIDLRLNSVFELLGKDEDNTDKFEIYDSHTIEVSNSEDESWSVSFRFNSSNNYRYKAFTNLLVNYQGGTHEKVAIRCIRRAFLNIFDKNKELAPGDVTGLDLVVSCLIKDPNFSSQTKDYLVVNNNVFKELDANLYTEIDKYFWKHRGLYSKIYDKFVEIKRKLANLKANKEIMNVIKVADESEIKKGKRPSAGVGKLIECTSKDIKGTELHIVEGASASGCVNFDTEIYDVNFNRLKIGELARIYEDPSHKPYYTFSCSPEGVIEVSKIKHCWKTKTTDKLVRITFDNGEMVECTPDHRFMMRDGTYKPAEELEEGSSLMPIYYSIGKDGRRHVQMNYDVVIINCINCNGKVVRRSMRRKDHRPVYHLSSEHPDVIIDDLSEFSSNSSDYNYLVRHHIDNDKLNDEPSNIMLMTNRNHRILHNKIKNFSTMSKEDRITMAKIGARSLRNKLDKDPVFRSNVYRSMSLGHRRRTKEEKDASSRKRLSNLDINLVSKKQSSFMKNAGANYHNKRLSKQKLTLGRKIVSKIQELGLDFSEENYYNVKSEYFSVNYPKFDNYLILEATYPNYTGNYHNHKVTKVEWIEGNFDVYDIEVDSEYHNFPLASGVFIHNSFIKARDPRIHAILPLRGKILNTTKVDSTRAFNNQEIRDITNAVGTGILDKCNPDLCRYEKIIISADSDVDGEQIESLVLGVFLSYFQPLIEAGKVYIMDSSLYGYYKDNLFYPLKDPKDLPDGCHFLRFKGLGSMESDQLYGMMLNKDTRNLIKVGLGDARKSIDILARGDEKKELLIDRGVIVNDR